MIALGIVLFALAARTETGKADAGIGTAARTALAVHRDAGAAARPALRRVVADPRLQRAVVAGRPGAAERRMRELVRDPVVAMERMRSVVDGPEYLGAISIARRGAPFTRAEEELLEYLAGQAVVSIENASLHETVERQAVSDHLTGLANMRAFNSILGRELERSRRFDSPLGLVMLDMDDFKRVNDTYGHQQGDEVLAQVAGVLRGLSRDLDAPPGTAGRSWRSCCLRRMSREWRCWRSA
jgi:GGDEF domain-containing protein